MADKVLEEVTKVDRSSMKKADTIEKNVLPDAEGNVKLDYPIEFSLSPFSIFHLTFDESFQLSEWKKNTKISSQESIASRKDL